MQFFQHKKTWKRLLLLYTSPVSYTHLDVYKRQVYSSSGLTVAKFLLRLAFKLRIANFNADNGCQAFSDIITGKVWLAVLEKLILSGVIVKCCLLYTSQGPGTYSPRPSDPRLLAIPASCSRVADCSPNWDVIFEICPRSRVRFPLFTPL